ncbi:hypothetical protein [Roseofilum sp. Guam]|uniref:hypothetical protein n=1 Tax=Roseofilum sp. Guam TaxID=2821502 RepID=UPI001B23225E|nr:hypothetical protein [Roseofilum sp. Guam]MBP0031437.1 hypothetical protein [Roseofilum sp. Guam]
MPWNMQTLWANRNDKDYGLGDIVADRLIVGVTWSPIENEFYYWSVGIEEDEITPDTGSSAVLGHKLFTESERYA